MINLKKVLLTAFVTTAALGLAAVPVSAKEVSKETTDLGISFETDGANKPGEGPFKDNLAIVWTPSRMDFGTQKATGNIATYNNTVTDPQYLVVNDDRKTEDGTFSAWKVNATLSNFTTGKAGDDNLAAKLTFTLGEVKKYDIGEDIDPATNDFKPAPLDNTSLTTFTPDDSIELGNKSKDVSLEANGTSSAAILAKNTTNKLNGGFATEIQNTKLVVTTDEKSAGKSYKATLSWSLEDTY